MRMRLKAAERGKWQDQRREEGERGPYKEQDLSQWGGGRGAGSNARREMGQWFCERQRLSSNKCQQQTSIVTTRENKMYRGFFSLFDERTIVTIVDETMQGRRGTI